MSALPTDEGAFWVGLISYLTDPRGDAPDLKRRGDTSRSREFSRLSDAAARIVGKRLGLP